MASISTQPSNSAARKEEFERLKADISESWGPPLDAPLIELAEWQTIFRAWKATSDQAADPDASSVPQQSETLGAGPGTEDDGVWQLTKQSVRDAEVRNPFKDFTDLVEDIPVWTVKYHLDHPTDISATNGGARDKPRSIFLKDFGQGSPWIRAKFVKVDKDTGAQSERSFSSSRQTMTGYTRHVTTMKEERGGFSKAGKYEPVTVKWVSVLDHYADKYKSWSAYSLKIGISLRVCMAVNSAGNRDNIGKGKLPTLHAPWQILEGESVDTADSPD